MQKEARAGFTKGRRVEDNIFVLRYYVEETFRRKKELIVTAIDFSKAFDSVNRGKIIDIDEVCSEW
jgi:hypothetical protein